MEKEQKATLIVRPMENIKGWFKVVGVKPAIKKEQENASDRNSE